MQIPETQMPTADLLALITAGNTKRTTIRRQDGSEEIIEELDHEGVFWGTQNVNSNKFGDFVKEYKDLEELADDVQYHMCGQRAMAFADGLRRHTKPFKYGIVGKSSETMRDKHNNQRNLIDKVKPASVEKKYVVKDELKKAGWQGIFGIDENKERDG